MGKPMSTTSVAAARPPAIVGAFPAELSRSPLLGIVGVILGAGIVTLTARLVSLGLADLKGNVGIGFDDGAWIGTVFNAALIFIGPFSVYLGALLGPRRVLLAGASAFTLICSYLPLVHSYSFLLFLLAIAGFASGTFYPLTLTFALRNIPLRYLAIVLALYVACIEGSVNYAPSLYGFFRDYFSWRWMFWIPAVLTPAMMACIYFGIPSSPRKQSKKEPPSFAGLLFLSAGLALVFSALDQGQRLDWWRSGAFTSLFAGGSLFLLGALAQRWRRPNWLIDLPYLEKWNTVLLGIGLFTFRFALLGTIVIIPQSLAMRGLDAAQYGPAVLWSAVGETVLAFIGALFLTKGIDTRLIMAIGFASIAFACIMNSDFTSAWAAENYFRTALLMAVGQSFAMLGLVSSIILQAAFTGALDAPQRVLTFSAFFHTIRLFGGQTGAVYMVRYIAEREKLHSNLLGLHMQSGNWITADALRQMALGLAAKSSGPLTATRRAVDIIALRARLQAYSLTMIDGLHLIAWGCAAMLLLTVVLHRPSMSFGQMTTLQDEIPQEESKP